MLAHAPKIGGGATTAELHGAQGGATQHENGDEKPHTATTVARSHHVALCLIAQRWWRLSGAGPPLLKVELPTRGIAAAAWTVVNVAATCTRRGIVLTPRHAVGHLRIDADTLGGLRARDVRVAALSDRNGELSPASAPRASGESHNISDHARLGLDCLCETAHGRRFGLLARESVPSIESCPPSSARSD